MVSYRTLCDLRRSTGKYSVAHLQTVGFIFYLPCKSIFMLRSGALVSVACVCDHAEV